MARRPYSGTADAYVIDTTGKPLPGRDELGNILVSGKAYNAATGGTQITDLQNLDGSPISGGILVPDQDGRIPQFLGPDGRDSMWLDFGAGTFLFNTVDLPARVATIEATLAAGGGGGGGGTTVDQPPASAVVYSAAFRNSRPPTSAGSFTWTCDGVADQVEIQAAIDAVAARGGGKVQLLGPTFYISAAIRLKTAIWLSGEGMGSVIRPTTDFQTGMVMLYETRNSSNLDTYGCHLTKLTDFTLDGAGAQVHGVHYIANSGQIFNSPPISNPDPSHWIRDLHIRSCGDAVFGGTGILLEGGNLRGGKFDTMRITACSGNGVWLKGAVDSHFSNIEVGSSGSGGPTPSESSTAPIGHAFYVGAGDNCIFTGCKGWYSRWSGFYNRATRVGYVNCQAQDNHGYGFTVPWGNASFDSCHADSNGQANDATRGRAGFRITADSVSLVGCHSYDRGGQAWQQQYGYSFTTGFTDGVVAACISKGNAVAAISGAAASSTPVDIHSVGGK